MTLPKNPLETFYCEFEEVFRLSEKIVKSRLEFYGSLFDAVKKSLSETLKFLDIGCGRGEFLELAKVCGFEVEGVEINRIYVEICQNKGFKVYHTDGLSFLKNTPDEQYHIISLIHVIEHLKFEYLLELLSEVYRVLKPGGILILETPNIKNPIVGFYNFWLDPTHKRPVHEELIKFMGKKVGFSYIEVMGINAEPLNTETNLADIFFNSAPDISIILLKETEKREFFHRLTKTVEELKEKASKDLEELVREYDKILKNFRENIEIQLRNTEIQLRLQEEGLKYQAELIVGLIERVNVLETILMTIYNSKLWHFYRFLSKVKRNLMDIPKNFAFFFYRKVEKSPALYRVIRNYLNRNPGLKACLKRFLFQESFSSISENFNEAKVDKVLDLEERIFMKKLLRFKNEGLT